MKKMVVLLVALFAGGYLLMAQPVKVLKKTITLEMPMPEDDVYKGTRGASVLWHPVQKKYYAGFAGNKSYPLAVFDAAGKRQSGSEQKTLVDLRGLWYNAAAKEIRGNRYMNADGWFRYKYSVNGAVSDYTDLGYGSMPGDQQVAAYNAAQKEVLFINPNEANVIVYSEADGEETELININWGARNEKEIDSTSLGILPDAYNNTTLIYTGISGAELGFLNHQDKTIELYNRQTGFLTRKIKLPKDAPAESSFNFSFCNGMYWLFDITNRKWYGYK